MTWVFSNTRRPKENGFYKTVDSIGTEKYCFFINEHWESDTGHPIVKWLDESEIKKPQLKLPIEELLAIGFKKQTTIEDELNPARDYYEILCVNGCFYCNPNEEQYRWYQKIVIGKYSNDIHLNIEELPELYMILQCFRVPFNVIIK